MDVKQLNGLSELVEAYDGFIFDLWGVVHDGSRTFSGVIETLTKLKEAGKKVVFLSNSPQRAVDNEVHLETLSVMPDMYEGIITSGEVSHRKAKEGLLEEWGKNYLCLGSGRYNNFLQDIGGKPVFDEEDADFILNGSVVWHREEIERYIPLFERAAARNIPMLCTNPDKVVCVGKSAITCAGTLAAKYEELGGKVTYFGKPYVEVYEECKKLLKSDKVLAVGDNMETDVKGALDFGYDSLLVKCGVHRDEFAENSLEELLKAYNYSPKYILEEVIW